MKQSGFGIASLILGIVGLVFSCFIVGIIPAFLGLIFAIIALCQKNTKNGMAIAGLICSIIGIVFSAIIILLGIAGSGNTSQTVSTNKKQEEVRSSSAQTESTMISPGYSFDANLLQSMILISTLRITMTIMAYMLLPLGKNIFALKLLLRTMQKLTAMLAVSTSSAMQMIPSAMKNMVLIPILLLVQASLPAEKPVDESTMKCRKMLRALN